MDARTGHTAPIPHEVKAPKVGTVIGLPLALELGDPLIIAAARRGEAVVVSAEVAKRQRAGEREGNRQERRRRARRT